MEEQKESTRFGNKVNRRCKVSGRLSGWKVCRPKRSQKRKERETGGLRGKKNKN